jgi:phage terminase small subunit
VAKRKASPPAPLHPSGLTDRQRLFCHAYANNGGTGKQAAIEAGYSEHTAEQQASRALRNVKVRAYLDPLLEARVRKMELRADRLDERLAAIAYRDLDPAVLTDPETGEALPMKAIPEDARRGIAGVKVKELYDQEGGNVGRIVEFKLIPETDRVKAIELGYKRLGLLKEKLEIKGKVRNLSHEEVLLLAKRIRDRKLAGRAGPAGGKQGGSA